MISTPQLVNPFDPRIFCGLILQEIKHRQQAEDAQRRQRMRERRQSRKAGGTAGGATEATVVLD